jgi:hypothetical protein
MVVERTISERDRDCAAAPGKAVRVQLETGHFVVCTYHQDGRTLNHLVTRDPATREDAPAFTPNVPYFDRVGLRQWHDIAWIGHARVRSRCG